jgi:hypothetical protein
MLKILKILQISTNLFTEIKKHKQTFINTKVIKNGKLLRIKLIKTALVFGPDEHHRVQTQEQF